MPNLQRDSSVGFFRDNHHRADIKYNKTPPGVDPDPSNPRTGWVVPTKSENVTRSAVGELLGEP